MRLNFFVTVFAVIFTVNQVSCRLKPLNEDDDLEKEFSYRTIKDLNDDEYEVVQFWHKKNGSTANGEKEIRLRRSGETHHLTLRSVESNLIRENTPVWLAHSEDRLERADETIIKEAVRFYEDPGKVIGLYEVNADEDINPYFVGRIDKRSVSPLSDKAVEALINEKPYLFNDTLPPGTVEKDYILSSYHVLSDPKREEAFVDFRKKFDKVVEEFNKTRHSRLKRGVDVVYPKIMLVLDYNKKFSSIREFRFLDLLGYVISFWNSVDLRYRSLDNPEVRLMITGIVVNMQRDGLHFIRDAIDSKSGLLNAYGAIEGAGKWIVNQRTIPINDHDLLITMTNMELCGSKFDKCKSDGTLGLAYLRGVCYIKHMMTGIIHDEYDFSGIGTAAHEVGHILGATHDMPKSAAHCRDKHGYIMSWNARFHDRPYEWSDCSKKDFSSHLRSNNAQCYESNELNHDQGKPIKEMLIGKAYTPAMQCDRLGYGVICNSPDICRNLRCRHKLWFCVSTNTPAHDGTPCDDGGVCRNGVCEK